jgi:cob(I)alamin adenosyltransferase
MKIYTKTGDSGETSLLSGQRVRKDDPRLEAYGTTDELNSCLGWCLSLMTQEVSLGELTSLLNKTQENLFVIGSHLACDDSEIRKKLPELPASAAVELESAIDKMESQLQPLRNFILPGGHEIGARLHMARTLCRRAERSCVAFLDAKLPEQERAITYLNRLSDFLFVAARFANQQMKANESIWAPRKS